MFHVPRHGRIPLHNSILKWDDECNVHGGVANSLLALDIQFIHQKSLTSKMHYSRVKLCLPRQSAASLQALNIFFQRILCRLKISSPYDSHYKIRLKHISFHWHFLELLDNDGVWMFYTCQIRPTLTCQAIQTNQIPHTGMAVILCSSTKGLSILRW
jgi:hypothetical protein